MIARLVGRLAQKSPEALIVDVHGVGYRVMVSLNAFAALPAQGAEVELAHPHPPARERARAVRLRQPGRKALFSALITVSGVGPRMALNILSGLPAADLRDALAAGNVARLVAVPGRRQAHRRAADRRAAGPGPQARGRCAGDAGGAADSEAVSALVNLGYRQPEAERAVRAVSAAGAKELAEVIRRALQKLSA